MLLSLAVRLFCVSGRELVGSVFFLCSCWLQADWLNLDCAAGYVQFEISYSFADQALAQLELLKN